MVKACSVWNCRANSVKNKNRRFCIIPKNKHHHDKWLSFINRAKIREDVSIDMSRLWDPDSPYFYLCFVHFVTGGLTCVLFLSTKLLLNRLKAMVLCPFLLVKQVTQGIFFFFPFWWFSSSLCFFICVSKMHCCFHFEKYSSKMWASLTQSSLTITMYNQNSTIWQ